MKTVSYAIICLIGMLGMAEAQFDAKKCQNYNDCPTTLCCGWATPQISRYGTRHKICYRPNQKLYMNYNGYKFDFECDPIPKDEIEEKIEEIKEPETQKETGLEEYNVDR